MAYTQKSIDAGQERIERDIQKVLKNWKILQDEIAQNVNQKTVLRRAGAVLLERLKSNAPVKTGKLRDSLEWLPFRRAKNAVFAGPNYKKGGQHAHLIEYGYTKNKKYVKAHPFILPTYEQTKYLVLSNLEKEIEMLKDKAVKRMSKS